MKKMISQIMVSVDGFYEGKYQEIDWHNVDEGHNDYAVEMLKNTSTLLFGRKTYQIMEQYWPTAQSKDDSQLVADLMNQLPKTVFSKTLNSANWNQTTLVKENIEQYVTELKRQAEKDLVLIGSGEIVSYLTNRGLIDEYHIIVNPLILAEGNHFLKNISKRIPLKFVGSRTFNTGNILLIYQLA